MTTPRGRARRARAVVRLAAWIAIAAAPAAFGDDGGTRLLDGGSPAGASTAALTAEDREVLDNLELLENLDASSDLDLLIELSNEREDASD